MFCIGPSVQVTRNTVRICTVSHGDCGVIRVIVNRYHVDGTRSDVHSHWSTDPTPYINQQHENRWTMHKTNSSVSTFHFTLRQIHYTMKTTLLTTHNTIQHNKQSTHAYTYAYALSTWNQITWS